jgi:hypothetical protein
MSIKVENRFRDAEVQFNNDFEGLAELKDQVEEKKKRRKKNKEKR